MRLLSLLLLFGSLAALPAATGDLTGLQSRQSDGTIKAIKITAPGAGTVLRFTGTPSAPFTASALTTADITGLGDYLTTAAAVTGYQAKATPLTTLSALANGSGTLTNNGAGVLTWTATGGTGTVTSVGVSSPAGITVGATPITTNGTITLTLDPDLVSIAALTTTSFGRGLLDDANAAAARTTMGLGAVAILADLSVPGAIGGTTPSTGAFTSLSSSEVASFTSVALTGGISFPDNIRQTFNPGATVDGLNVGSIAGDPATPANGGLWYDSTANELTARINGANVALGSGGGGSTAASALTGTTLASNVTASSLTSAAGGAFGTGAYAAAFYRTSPGAIGQVTPDSGAFTTLTTTGTIAASGAITAPSVTSAFTGSLTGNASTVTTNANLTGVVTSVGNATAIADAALTWAKIGTGKPTTLSGYGIADSLTAAAADAAYQAKDTELTAVATLANGAGALTNNGAGVFSYVPAAGSGTVTSASVVTANGVSATTATASTTPAHTFTLGAITPSSVAAVGAVTGSNLSGTNTGNQTTIAGITGTLAEFNTALTGADFASLAGSEALTNKSVNGVTLASGGTATLYLSQDGTYTTPAGGGGGSPGGSTTQVQLNNAGAFGGVAGLVADLTTGALTQAQTTDATTNVNSLSANTSTTATVGAQKWSPFIRQRASGWGTAGSAAQTVDYQFGVKPIQGTAPTGSWVLQSSINGVAATDVLTVENTGNVFVPFGKNIGFTAANSWQYGSGSATLFSGHVTNSVLYINGGTRLGVPSAGTFTWSNSTISSATATLTLLQKAAANLQQGAADAAAPVAQTSSVQSVVAGTTDTPGVQRKFTGSQGTGTGAGGDIVFCVAPAGSTGSSQNALVDAFKIVSDKSVFVANVIAAPGTPTGGGVIYVEAGALKYKGSSGTVTTLGAP